MRPTYSIRLLAENLVRDDPRHAHAYKLREERGRPLLDNGGIYLLELKKFQADRIAGMPGFQFHNSKCRAS